MLQPKFTITSLKPSVPENTKTDLYFLLSIQVPSRDSLQQKERSRLNLALAIDRSGSMSGKPLTEAKECAKRIARSLGEGDTFSVVSYDDKVRTVLSATRVTDINAIIRAIDTIEIGGNTNLHGGWIGAVEQASLNLAPDVISRVMVLSDGNANHGITDIETIKQQAAALAAKGISTSTVGLGRSFNEDLMTALADAGLGQSNYGETSDDLWPNFEAEFGLLSSTAGKNVKLKLTTPAPFTIEMKTDYQKSSSGEWLISNLVYEAEVNALVRVSVEACSGKTATPLQASVVYENTDGTLAAELKAEIILPVVRFATFTTAPSDPKVLEQIKLVEAAELQKQAKIAARAYDFKRVGELAEQMVNMSDGNQWIMGIAQNMQQLAKNQDAIMISKEATYASSKLTRSYSSTTGNEGSFFAKRTRQGTM